MARTNQVGTFSATRFTKHHLSQAQVCCCCPVRFSHVTLLQTRSRYGSGRLCTEATCSRDHEGKSRETERSCGKRSLPRCLTPLYVLFHPSPQLPEFICCCVWSQLFLCRLTGTPLVQDGAWRPTQTSLWFLPTLLLSSLFLQPSVWFASPPGVSPPPASISSVIP